MDIWYCTREDVMSSPDISLPSRDASRVDQVIASASRDVDALCHRVFYPEIATRRFAAPDCSTLYLKQHDLLSVGTLSSGGTLLGASDYFLEPQASGPPYTRVELNTGVNGAWTTEDTRQQAVEFSTTLWGYSLSTLPSGGLASSPNASVTTVDVTEYPGVGALLTVGTERMVVTGWTWLTSAQTGSVTSAKSDVSITVSDGTKFLAGENILLDSETMAVTGVSGNVLTVERAVGGSVLAAHAGTAIYTPRRLTVARGVLGTTATSHTASDAVVKHAYPALVRELTIAYSLNNKAQRLSQYSRVSGSGDNAREYVGRGVAVIEEDCYRAHGRKGRSAAA